jgi:hypothetical protein
LFKLFRRGSWIVQFQHGDCRCRCLLFGDGVNLWPVGEEFYDGQEISDYPVALQEMYSDVK